MLFPQNLDRYATNINRYIQIINICLKYLTFFFAMYFITI